MQKLTRFKLLLFFYLLFTMCCINKVLGKEYKAATINEVTEYSAKLQAGDTLTLLNGLWKNAALVFTVSGTADKNITIRAEQEGKVILTGNSSLQLGGNYVNVFGLYFTDGAADDGVISFRTSADKVANYCRVSNCAIYNYNPSSRMNQNSWVVLYGKNNRFDHNYLSDKKNLGATLVVELNDEKNQQNFHRIDHNYFGRRERMGANGGETMRIGNSTFSRSSSNTIIENNLFEKCNGEVEIISIKSSDNIIKGNTFLECEGGLVLRHGNRNVIDGNRFIGNNKPMTGGVRVINAGHKIINNYFYGLKGERFRSALTIMNAVPNSPINRYDPVRDVVVAGNTFIDCENIELCAGKDLERTATPQNVLLAGNIFYTSKPISLFHVYDDISGISFKENYSNHPQLHTSVQPSIKITEGQFPLLQGVPSLSVTVQSLFNTSGLLNEETNFGTSWLDSKTLYKRNKVAGNRLTVTGGSNTLYHAVLKAKPYDTILLTNTTPYFLSKPIEVRFPLFFSGEEGATIQFAGEDGGFSFFSIENGGSLYLSNIILNGSSKNGIAESFIRTGKQPSIEHYKLFVDGCSFMNLTDGRKHALKVYAGTFADSIVFSNSFFHDITGDVISIAAEKEDKGYYNAENIVFTNCVFNKVLMGGIDIYRGGNDESTTGPFVTIDHCTFSNVGNTELGYAVRLYGVQHSTITNSLFNNSGKSGRSIWFEDFGWTKNRLEHCNFFNSGKVQSFYNNIIKGKQAQYPPQFVNEESLNFSLKPSSQLKKTASDNKDMGAIYKNGKLHLTK